MVKGSRYEQMIVVSGIIDMGKMNGTGTILFGKINREKASLLDFIDKEQVGVNDEIQQEILQKLICFSWEEVLSKLEPNIFVVLSLDKFKVESTTMINVTSLREYNECYKINIGNSIDLILKHGQCNLQILIESMLCPPLMKEFIADKNELIRSFVVGKEKKAKRLLEELYEKYNNSLFLLSYYLNTYQTIEAELGMDVVYFSENNEYQIGIIEQSCIDEMNYLRISIKEQRDFNIFICKVIERISGSNIELWKNCLMLGYTSILEVEMARQIYEKYVRYWSNIVKCFWREGQPLIEKLLGIYYFFKNEGKQQRDQWLLISNVEIDEIIERDEQKKLRIYLEYCNEKKYLGNTIWFAIVPTIKNAKQTQFYRERFRGSEHKNSMSVDSLKREQEVLDILSEYKIQTFLSSSGETKQKKLYVQEGEVETWLKEISRIFNRENATFAYPCYPNFVCIPKDHAVYKIEKEVIYLEGISVEASYIAAKIVTASSQNTWFKKSEYVPRLNFVGYKENTIEELQNKGYGFWFVPSDKETLIKNTKAASFIWGREDYFREVFIMTYVERILRLETDNFKEELIETFLSKFRTCLHEEELGRGKRYGILRRGESIDYEIINDECNLFFGFTGHIDDKKIRTIKRVENK